MQFTLFIAHSVFTHLYSDQTEYYLKEAIRILKPTGVLYTTWFLFNRDFFPVLAPHQQCLYMNEIVPIQAVYYDWDWLLQLFKRLDIVILKVIWIQIKLYPYLNHNRVNK